MRQIAYTDGTYRTDPQRVSLLARMFPSLTFYRRFLGIVWRASIKAKRGRYDGAAWCESSLNILGALERVGVRIEIEGIEHVERLHTPCVVIANHMSVLETVLLPAILRPVRPVTFIVKESLLTYPVFSHIMRSRDPIALTRTNPRQDLRAVLEGGCDRLGCGISIVVFPQTTRAVAFDPKQFSTIGVKLAARAKVPIVPLVLRTDAWSNGKRLKDFGPIDPSKPVHFSFGEPIQVEGRGAEEHQKIIERINAKLQQWH
ncbi:MAG: lysophospholipid acyltransferase family protein [Thermoguttaceae bacterium]